MCAGLFTGLWLMGVGGCCSLRVCIRESPALGSHGGSETHELEEDGWADEARECSPAVGVTPLSARARARVSVRMCEAY